MTPTIRAAPQDELAVACTLSAPGLRAQARRWAELRRRAEIGQTDTREGTRVRFRAREGVAGELQELVTIENRCCPWAMWTVDRAQDELVLVVTSGGHGVDVIHEMFSSPRGGEHRSDPESPTA